MAKKSKHNRHMITILVWGTLAIAVFFAIRYWLDLRYPPALPEFAGSYRAAPLSLHCVAGKDEMIKFEFTPSETAVNETPKFSVNEEARTATTVIKFNNVGNLGGQFSYNQVINCPLIGRITNTISNGSLLVTVTRTGAYVPASVKTDGPLATIILPVGNNNFPKITGQKPDPDSAAFPALRTISFRVTTTSPLEELNIFINGAAVNATSTLAANGDYLIQFPYQIAKDTDYSVKAVASDDQGRVTASDWTFTGQIPSQTILGKDRFKFLGWWGHLTADGIVVRSAPDSGSDKLGTLSSINNIKVLKEVYGQSLPSAAGDYNNNLWYQIDGGKYPAGYIFSDFVAPITQPQPPANPQRPVQVVPGDNWIDVNLAKKVFTLYTFDNEPLLVTFISPGRPENPTQPGTYNVWYKLYKAEMIGGPPLHSYTYDLKNIPWVMFYNNDYALHGTYWHDRFGTTQSAGCTNMTQGDAKFVFDHSKPNIPDGQKAVFSSTANPGTVVYNHD
jgi:hypothetical protein